MPDIERVTQATLLGIDITLSTAAYVNRMLLQINRDVNEAYLARGQGRGQRNFSRPRPKCM